MKSPRKVMPTPEPLARMLRERFKLGARWEPDPSSNCVPCQRYRRAVGMLRTGR